MNFNVFNNEDPSKSYLEIEQELLDSGEISSEDDLARLYPNVVGDQHRDTCMCPKCDPNEFQVDEDAIWEDIPWEIEHPDDGYQGIFIKDHVEYDPAHPPVYQGALPLDDDHPF